MGKTIVINLPISRRLTSFEFLVLAYTQARTSHKENGLDSYLMTWPEIRLNGELLGSCGSIRAGDYNMSLGINLGLFDKPLIRDIEYEWT